MSAGGQNSAIILAVSAHAGALELSPWGVLQLDDAQD
jgi:hypothetical protein